MNLLSYPKEYFDTYFKAKKVKKFDFKQDITEFICVIILASIVNSIVLYFTEMFDLSTALLVTVISFVIYSLVAVVIRVAFMLFGGKSTFKKDAAVMYKYASGFIFFITVLSLIAWLLESIYALQIAVGLVFVYLCFVFFFNVIDAVLSLEKLGNHKAYQVLSVVMTIILALLTLAGWLLMSMMPVE